MFCFLRTFIGLMPVTMAGALATLLNVFVRDFPNTYLGADNGITKFFTPLIGVNGLVWTGTLAVMAVVFTASLGYFLAKAYNVDPLSDAIVSLAAFIMGIFQSAKLSLTLSETLSADTTKVITDAGWAVSETAIDAASWGFFPFSKYMGGKGLFTAMIFGFILTILFAKMMQKNIIIRMPESVPPAVSKAFAAIIPGVTGLYVSGTIYFLFEKFAGMPIIDWISESIQKPLLGLSQGYGAVFIIVLLVHVLWFFGLHGTNIMAPVLQTIYGTSMVVNTNAFQTGADISYKWVAGSFEAFVWPGGAGVTLMLLVAILIFSKRADYKTIGGLAIGPGLFNIRRL